jgi:hypothetical protein
MVMRLIAAIVWLIGMGTVSAIAAESQEKPDSLYSLLTVREGAIHVLVDDIDDDSLADLIFTSHGGNFVQVFKQVAPRRFEAAAEQTQAGFHPNDTVLLPGSPKRYLINAEGDGSLKVVTAQPDGRLLLTAERPENAPRATIPFNWPGWGISLAVVPYSGNTLRLLRDFNAEKAEAKAIYPLTLGWEPKHVRRGDLNGDGIEELVLPAFRTNEIWVVEYPGPDKGPVPRRVASFQRGWPRHVIPFDVDRNGTLDLLVPLSTRSEIVVLRNDGKGNFSEAKAIPYPQKPGIHVMTTGQERDGTRYLLAGGINTLVLYRENKDQPGSFEPILLGLSSWPNWLELTDIDGDGWLDAVLAMQGNVSSRIVYGPLWETFNKLAPQEK